MIKNTQETNFSTYVTIELKTTTVLFKVYGQDLRYRNLMENSHSVPYTSHFCYQPTWLTNQGHKNEIRIPEKIPEISDAPANIPATDAYCSSTVLESENENKCPANFLLKSNLPWSVHHSQRTKVTASDCHSCCDHPVNVVVGDQHR